MSEPDRSVSLKPSTLRSSSENPIPFKQKPAFLQVTRTRSNPVRIAMIGNHLPRQCGIATFTTDLCDAISVEYGAAGVFVVAVNDPQSSYHYPARVRFEITESDPSSYKAAADFLNSSNIDLVCLQHEYGIFGGSPAATYCDCCCA